MDHPCSICQIEFPSSSPNEGVIDAPLRGGGPWGYFCAEHMNAARPGAGHWLATGKPVEPVESSGDRLMRQIFGG